MSKNRTELAVTKVTKREKSGLEYLKAKKQVSISDLIRDALLQVYDLEEAATEGDSFFDQNARLVEHSNN